MIMKSIRKFKWNHIVAIAALVIGAVVTLTSCSTVSIPEDKQCDYEGAYLTVSTYTGAMTYQPHHITVDLGDYNAEIHVDFGDVNNLVYQNYNDYAYMCFRTHDDMEKCMQTEIIISTVVDEALMGSEEIISTLKKSDIATIDLSNDTMAVEASCKELIGGLGYIYVYQQTAKTSEYTPYTAQMVETLVDSTLYSKDVARENKATYLEFEGLGVYDVNKLPMIEGAPGIVAGADGIVGICNFETPNAYGQPGLGIVYVAALGNPMMQCEAMYLEHADGWNNLYLDIRRDQQPTMGYRGFGVQTGKGFFYFKPHENAIEGMNESIYNWLGILPEDTKIDTVFSEDQLGEYRGVMTYEDLPDEVYGYESEDTGDVQNDTVVTDEAPMEDTMTDNEDAVDMEPDATASEQEDTPEEGISQEQAEP